MFVVGACQDGRLLIGAGYGRCTVAKVQIGLTGTAVSLKRDLERIAKRADTNTSEGLNFVLQGAEHCFIPELLHP